MLGSEFERQLDPRGYHCPIGTEAYNTHLAIEHAAGLDPQFPELFAEATHLIQRNKRRINNLITT